MANSNNHVLLLIAIPFIIVSQYQTHYIQLNTAVIHNSKGPYIHSS